MNLGKGSGASLIAVWALVLAGCGAPGAPDGGASPDPALDSASGDAGAGDSVTPTVDVAADTVATDAMPDVQSAPDVPVSVDTVAPPVDAAPDSGVVDGSAAADATSDTAPPAPPGCVLEPSPAHPLAGGPCAGGVLACPLDQGCHEGTCGACSDAAECRDLQGCRADGSCGDCAGEADCRDSEACREGFCVPATLPVWHLTIDPADWANMKADAGAKLEVPCGLSVGGVDYAGCTVRLRGGSSLYFPKKSFRIELPDGAPHPGYARKINLRAEYNDPSFLRNFLSLYAFGQMTTLPTPRARFLVLELNGETYGLMAEVERVGDAFLEARGRDRDAPMYEADPPGELMAAGPGSMVPLPEDVYPIAFDKNDDDGDYSDLRALVEDGVWADHVEAEAKGAPVTTRIREEVDVPSYLDYLATMMLVQNHDHVRKNYYLSRQVTAGEGARWEAYPWDLDLSLGCLWTSDYDTLCTEHTAEGRYDAGVVPDGVSPGYPVEAFYNLLIHLTLKDPVTLEPLRGRLCAMTQSPVWIERLPALARAMEETLLPAVMADERDRNDDVEQFHSAVDQVASFMEARAAYLWSTLDCSLCELSSSP